MSLAMQITAAGASAPSYADILTSLTASFQSIFGSDALLTPDTQEGQWLAIVALAIHDENQTGIALYNSFSPTFAQGVQLSNLVKINGIARQVATNSTATVSIGGVAGTVIDNGVVQDANKNLWNLPAEVIIPGGGTIDVTAAAQVQGAISAGIASITVIFTPVLGWQTVSNAAAAAPGAPVESDAALRRRQALSTGLPALTPLGAIAAAVANVVGVTRSTVYENNTGSTDGNGVPGHSIAVVTQGGSSTQIAQVIEAKKSPGTGTFGSTAITVNDPAGLPIVINFFQLTLVPIFITVTIQSHAGYVGSTGAALQQALVDFVNSLTVGGDVFYNWLIAIAGQLGTPVGETYNVTDLRVGIAASPTGTADVLIAFNAASTCIFANVILNTL